MKKLFVLLFTGLILTSLLMGCSPKQNTSDADNTQDLNNTQQGGITAKIAINIEGVVREVDGDRITLESGQVVIINDETSFETQNVAEIVAVNDEIAVGNFIQGFTQDDENSDEVTALVINMNEPRNDEPMVSLSIFKGVITQMDEKTAIVTPNEDQAHILSSGDQVKVNLSGYDADFSIGDEIVVYYYGEIMESYPLQLNVSDVQYLSEFENDNQ